MSQRETDERFMRRCLELARRAEGRTAPNPMVGSVIVSRRGEVLAEGFHARAGAAHGEAAALAVLGGVARGATLYVNLEPCNHHGRTPPCAAAIAAAGVRRVVYGASDPVPGHRGGGAWLARRGVEVVGGVLRDACEEQNRGFLRWARDGRPWFCLKAGVTLDGKVATRTGQSRWITGEAARRDAHRLRNALDAIMVGVGTVRADRPRLDVRGVRGGRDPIRVVVDSALRTPATAPVLPAHGSPARTILATTAAAPVARERRLARAGAEVWRLPARRDGRVALPALARRLAREGITSVLVEGGPTLHGALLRARLADELVLYVAPMVVAEGLGWVGGPGYPALAKAPRMQFIGEPRRVGEDLVLTARMR